MQKLKLLVLILLLSLALSSCASTDPKEGASWYGLPPGHPNAAFDAGKACTDGGQCSQWCQAPQGSQEGAAVVGRCFGGRDHQFICWQHVKDGIADVAWCE